MRTALAILSEKKAKFYTDAMTAKEMIAADERWLNFLEATALMATVNALCTVDDPDTENWGKRLEGALGRSAAHLINLGEPVPADKLILKS